MTSMKQIQNEIIEEFSVFDDWMDKYEYLIEIGQSRSVLSEEEKRDEFLIQGCQSRVWLIPEIKEGRLFLRADSDAIITGGLATLIVRVFDGHKCQDIVREELFFIREIGLSENLSPTRANGLRSMVAKIKHYSEAWVQANS